MYVDLNQALAFMLVLLRMTGLLVTNPILGRRGIPPMLNAGFALILTILLTTSMPFEAPGNPTFAVFFLMGIKELAVGMIASFVLLLFLSILTIGGEIIDTQIGIGMAKVFDPGTNASLSLSSTLFNAMFILIFFSTNSHLTLIHLASQTFNIIPLGSFAFNFNVGLYLPEMFATLLVYAIKLCMPIVVIELITGMAVGLMMRIIPQINVFVVSIQFKLLFGMFCLIVLVVPFMAFFENMILLCFEQIGQVWQNIAV